MTHHRHAVNAPGAPAAVGAYSHAVVSNGLVFCSGQVALDPETGKLVEGDVRTQVRRCLENLAAVCQGAGARLSDAVRVTLYLSDLGGDWTAANEEYQGFFADEPPARVTIGVAALPQGARVEVDAVVALPD